jgi:membrane protein DedA with SNARE-associated domain
MVEWIQELIFNVGYLGLGFLSFLENIFPPMPSEIIMPLGGFLVAQGRLTFVGVVLAGATGSLLGAIVLYAIGWLFNQERLERWTARWGRWLLLDVEDVRQVFEWFERHGHKAVFFGRLVPGIRSLISVPAGASHMNLIPFMIYSTLGTVIWSGALAYGGMVLGQQYEILGEYIGTATYVVLGIIVLAGLYWLFRKTRQRGLI